MSAAGPSPARLYLLLCLMLFFWSLNYTVSKVALREFPPLLLAGLRREVGPGGDLVGAYRRWWQQQGEEHDRAVRRLAESLYRRGVRHGH